MLSVKILLVGAAFLCLIHPLLLYLWDQKKLRRFPNYTKLSGITGLGYVYERCRGFRSRSLHLAHQQHRIIRIGPNSLSFSSPEAIRSIYGHSTQCYKGDMYDLTRGGHASLLDVVDKGEHARKRRLLSNAFATRNLQQWEFKIADKVRRLLVQFDASCGGCGEGQIDFRRWTNLFTVDAITDIAASYRTGCLDRGDDFIEFLGGDGDEKRCRYIECLHAPRRLNSIVVWCGSWFPWLRRVLGMLPGLRAQWKKGLLFDELASHVAYQRVQRHVDGEEVDDLVGSLLQDKQGLPRNLDIGEVTAEMILFMDAGSDTTAIALTHVMYYLLRNPEALSRLRQEVNEAVAADVIIAPDATVRNLPYLRACLDESLRLSPPVAFGLNRKTPEEGMHIDGHWIPGGTTVAVPAYTAHRNPDIFDEPEEFRPERWLGDGAKKAQASFIPFSTGGRGCIGRNISYMEQSILVATLIRRYDFELPSPDWQLQWEEAFNLWPGPMPLSIRRRVSSCVQ
ncbi:hypothetical protein N8I77_012149 [Diaporthe amygdali]|uniref:Uncharacterized protein n=1 Tax=Phomopsis amygdali TaxID=1214568 RepID=A0AAD9S5K2_PHOAM|nr:hypothetical protein N8I77_012149 [Diaporthe amygdali]